MGLKIPVRQLMGSLSLVDCQRVSWFALTVTSLLISRFACSIQPVVQIHHLMGPLSLVDFQKIPGVLISSLVSYVFLLLFTHFLY